MNKNEYLAASSGLGEPVLAVVAADRSIGTSIINVDNVLNWPSKFVATSGTVDATTGSLDRDTVSVFFGHLSGSYIIIDEFAPGYSDIGNTENQVVVLKPTTTWADNVSGYINSLITSVANKEPLLPTTPTDPENKFLNGNKQWSAISIGNGGYSANLYFTTLTSTTVGTYKQISYTNEPTETELSGVANNNEVLFRTYIFDADINTTSIDAGLWGINYRVKVSNAVQTTQLKIEPFLRHTDGSETVLFSVYSDDINNTAYATIRTETNQPVFYCATTDRFGVRLYGKTTSPTDVTINTIVGDGYGAYMTLPIKLRHSQLRGLNEDTNYQHVTQSHINDTMLKSVYDTTGNGYVNGAESIMRTVYFQEAVTKGDPVYVSTTGTPTMVMRSRTDTTSTLPSIGVAYQSASAGSTGLVVVSGSLAGLNTGSYTPNQTLYVGVTGGLTSTKPSNNAQAMAIVARSGGSDGVIVVNPDYVADYVPYSGAIANLNMGSNNINLANTSNTSQKGLVLKNNVVYLSDFNYGNNGTVTTEGGNMFLGKLSGNLTTGSTATQTYHGSYNVALGDNTMPYLTTGFSNLAIGENALNFMSTGANNVGIGRAALRSLTTSSNNVGIGYYAGRYISGGVSLNSTSSNSIYLGMNAYPLANGDTNEIVIGYGAVGIGSNTAIIGNSNIVTTALRGDVVIGGTTKTTSAALDVQSTTKAFMPPRMTTTQRDAIVSPSAGMVIYNTTTNVLNFHNGTSWGAV